MNQENNNNKGFFKRIILFFKETREERMRMNPSDYFYFDKKTGEKKLLPWYVRFVNFFSVTLGVILFAKYMSDENDDGDDENHYQY